MENNNKSLNRAFFSYCLNPDIKFKSIEKDEQIVLLLRAHPFTQIYWVITTIFLIFLLIFSNTILGNIFSGSQVFFLNIAGIIGIFSYIIISFINWYFNVGIITNQRIINVTIYSVLYREITSTQLEKVQDITEKTGGYIEALLDFGDVFIETAASNDQNIDFNNVPQPGEVIQIINKLLESKQ